MKILEPSATIIPSSEDQTGDIEQCGRVCYRIDHERSASGFVQKIINRGHWSVLEMADISLVVQEPHVNPTKYIEVSRMDGTRSLVTGSVRALREWFQAGIDHVAAPAAQGLLMVTRPELFGDLPRPYASNMACHTVNPKWLYLMGDITREAYHRHHRVTVDFIVNRAVSHEIVRHRPCAFLQESQRYCAYREDVEFIRPLFFAKDTPEYQDWWNAMCAAEAAYKGLLKTSSPQAARTVLPNSTATRLMVRASLAEWQHIFTLRDSAAADPSMREVMAPLHEKFKEMLI